MAYRYGNASKKLQHNPEITFNDSDTVVLVVAVEFGAYDDFGKPMEVKGAGAGKVIGVG